MKPFAIAFSGRIKSGKSSLSAEVARRLGWTRVSFGDQVRRIAAIQGLDSDDREVLQNLGETQVQSNRRGFCQDVIAQATGWTRTEGLIIDGLRHLEVATMLSELVTPLRLRIVYVDTPDEVRGHRLSVGPDHERLHHWESHSTELQVPKKLRDVADLIVDGSATLDDAVQQTLAAVSRWSTANG